LWGFPAYTMVDALLLKLDGLLDVLKCDGLALNAPLTRDACAKTLLLVGEFGDAELATGHGDWQFLSPPTLPNDVMFAILMFSRAYLIVGCLGWFRRVN